MTAIFTAAVIGGTTHASLLLAAQEQGVMIVWPGLGLLLGLLAASRQRVAVVLGSCLGLSLTAHYWLSGSLALSPLVLGGLIPLLALLVTMGPLWVLARLPPAPDLLAAWPEDLPQLAAVGTQASLVIAFLTSTALRLAGVYPPEDWLVRTLLWWACDTASLVGIGALMLTLLSPHPHARSARLLAGAGIVASFLLSAFFTHQEAVLWQRQWSATSAYVQESIHKNIHQIDTHAQAVQALFLASQEVSPDEFRIFVAPFLRHDDPEALFMLYRSATDPDPVVVGRAGVAVPTVPAALLADRSAPRAYPVAGGWLLATPVERTQRQATSMLVVLLQEDALLQAAQPLAGSLSAALALQPPDNHRLSYTQLSIPIVDQHWRLYLQPLPRNNPFVMHIGSLVLLLGMLLTSAVSTFILHISGQQEVIEQQVRIRTRELRLAKEQAEAAMRARTAFLANMSHELRTPMNGVLGAISLLEQQALSDEPRRLVKIVRDSGQGLLALLNALLDLARIDSGRLVLEEEALPLGRLLRESLALFEVQAQEKGLNLELALDPSLPDWIEGDPLRLQQILGNLISNAVKFTAVGQVVVSAARCADVPEQWQLTVADTGPGIPPQRLPELFDRFVQADTSTTRRYGGSGLGLAIVGELVALMGGTITATAVQGEGATFVVRLPLRAAAGPPPARHTDIPVIIGDLRGLRVLLVDDHPINRLLARKMLDGLGCTVQEAEDGAEGVRLWDAWRPDVVLMDCQMPVMDGYEATRQIRAAEAACAVLRTPILALTANAFPSDIQDCQRAGMDDHISKPVRHEDLLAILARYAAPPEGSARAEAGLHQPVVSATLAR